MAEPFEYPCKVVGSPFIWVGHPDGEFKDDSPANKVLAKNREALVVWGGAEDGDLSYEFDETALVSLEDTFYLVQTSGCSCPSDTERWNVEATGTLSVIQRAIDRGEYKGYSFPKYALADLKAAIDLARSML